MIENYVSITRPETIVRRVSKVISKGLYHTLTSFLKRVQVQFNPLIEWFEWINKFEKFWPVSHCFWLHLNVGCSPVALIHWFARLFAYQSAMVWTTLQPFWKSFPFRCLVLMAIIVHSFWPGFSRDPFRSFTFFIKCSNLITVVVVNLPDFVVAEADTNARFYGCNRLLLLQSVKPKQFGRPQICRFRSKVTLRRLSTEWPTTVVSNDSCTSSRHNKLICWARVAWHRHCVWSSDCVRSERKMISFCLSVCVGSAEWKRSSEEAVHLVCCL